MHLILADATFACPFLNVIFSNVTSFADRITSFRRREREKSKDIIHILIAGFVVWGMNIGGSAYLISKGQVDFRQRLVI